MESIRKTCEKNYPSKITDDRKRENFIRDYIRGLKGQEMRRFSVFIKNAILRLEKFDLVNDKYHLYWDTMMKVVRPKFLEKEFEI